MTKLEEIVACKRQEVAQAKRERSIGSLEKQLKERPPVRDFHQAVRRPGILSLIAEVKRASPSAGAIRPGADAAAVAKEYEKAGAQAVSVLTDAKFFSGSLQDLASVRRSVSLPVLRKDFLLEEYQVLEAAAAGADAVLLIAAILEYPLLKRLLAIARDLSLSPLVEVHTGQELGVVLEAQAPLIGINNRNLATLQVDLKTTERLIRQIPKDRGIVSESGIRSRSDVEFLRGQGVDAILVGEELMAGGDIAAKVKELMR